MLQSTYILSVITIDKTALNIMKYTDIYSIINSDSQVLPKENDVDAEKTDEPIVKTDSLLILRRLFKYNIHNFLLLIILTFFALLTLYSQA